MKWSYNSERAPGVAVWLFAVAALVVALLVVGGATRLTGSGLSITDWKPISGVVPPLSARAWDAEFAAYKRIPQYTQLNLGMSLAQFRTLFWWEWGHRFLARVVGLVFLVGLVGFLVSRTVPRRLGWRLWAIAGVFALEPLVGWWMVASGLSKRVSVAPERLAVHLGLALLLFYACVWTGLEAGFGRARGANEPDRRSSWAAPALAALAYVQCLLGALVAGGRAGLVDGDWPLMGGRVFPRGYVEAGQGLLGSLLHSAPAVQFNHRLAGYALLAAVLAFAVTAGVSRFIASPVRNLSWILAAAVLGQATLGVLTLRLGDPLWLAALHQVGAVGVLATAVALAWRARRS